MFGDSGTVLDSEKLLKNWKISAFTLVGGWSQPCFPRFTEPIFSSKFLWRRRRFTLRSAVAGWGAHRAFYCNLFQPEEYWPKNLEFSQNSRNCSDQKSRPPSPEPTPNSPTLALSKQAKHFFCFFFTPELTPEGKIFHWF